jgi:hypothetical protein
MIQKEILKIGKRIINFLFQDLKLPLIVYVLLVLTIFLLLNK